MLKSCPLIYQIAHHLQYHDYIDVKKFFLFLLIKISVQPIPSVLNTFNQGEDS
jgi:hypothetical protein